MCSHSIKIVFLLVASLLPKIAHGKSFQDSAAQMARQLRSAKALNAKPLSSQCTDLSGNWEGICVDKQGNEERDRMVIVQKRCSSIEVDGLSVPIGGNAELAYRPGVRSPSDDFLSYSGTISLQWNDSQTHLFSLSTLSLWDAIGGILTTEMWLSGDQLRARDTARSTFGIDGSSNLLSSTMQDCTYNKVQP